MIGANRGRLMPRLDGEFVIHDSSPNPERDFMVLDLFKLCISRIFNLKNDYRRMK